ncbi:hypothetical protein FJT64_021216 [Amphibalanus amphitrite]|uniref:Uncharacterized protein n=1 Tax=Amphibalanus amphitrite TaxID=1232801 RepID=A0A6A4WJ84_AMPAM|nr:hypothetical protein FJT64_021216 [Amphibalanus amphitrite]
MPGVRMWTRQLLMTAAVPVPPGEPLGSRQRRCAGQLQLLTRRLARLCALTAAADSAAHREPVGGPKLTADAAVDAREQPGRIPPLPDLVQSCSAGDTASGRHYNHQNQQQRTSEHHLHQQERQQRSKESGAVGGSVFCPSVTPDLPRRASSVSEAGPAPSSQTLQEVGRALRRCADQLHSSRRKRRAAPEVSSARHSGRATTTVVLASASAALLLWCYRHRG